MVAPVTSPLASASLMISPDSAQQAALSQAGAAAKDLSAQAARAVQPAAASSQSGNAASASGPPTSDQVKARIAGVIADLVQRQKLSQGQARDLRDLFASVLANGASGAVPASQTQARDGGAGSLAVVQGFARAAQAQAGGYSPNGSGAAHAPAPLLVNYKS